MTASLPNRAGETLHGEGATSAGGPSEEGTNVDARTEAGYESPFPIMRGFGRRGGLSPVGARLGPRFGLICQVGLHITRIYSIQVHGSKSRTRSKHHISDGLELSLRTNAA